MKLQFNKKRIYNLFVDIIRVICIIILFYSGYELYKIYSNNQQAESVVEDVKRIVEIKEEIKEDNTEEVKTVQKITKEGFNKLKQTNSDVIGYLLFDSGLISEAVTKTTDNDYYLKHNLYKKYDFYGTVFMDYENSLSDTNISLYGHSSNNQTMKFQPLNNLYRNNQELENNLYFSFYTENEQRRYVISYMYDYNDFRNYNHRIRNFSTEEEFNEFFDYVLKKSKQTGHPIKYGDNFISLQVCLDNSLDKRVIVVAKEIERLPFE